MMLSPSATPALLTLAALALSSGVHAQPAAQEEVQIDWEEIRERRRADRIARGDVEVVRFEGEFLGSGLTQATPTEGIVLDNYDVRFTVGVRVVAILAGELPEGLSSPVLFRVHSPSMLFGLQGIRPAEGETVPQGAHLLRLWRTPAGDYDLDIEPLAVS